MLPKSAHEVINLPAFESRMPPSMIACGDHSAVCLDPAKEPPSHFGVSRSASPKDSVMLLPKVVHSETQLFTLYVLLRWPLSLMNVVSSCNGC